MNPLPRRLSAKLTTYADNAMRAARRGNLRRANYWLRRYWKRQFRELRISLPDGVTEQLASEGGLK